MDNAPGGLPASCSNDPHGAGSPCSAGLVVIVMPIVLSFLLTVSGLLFWHHVSGPLMEGLNAAGAPSRSPSNVGEAQPQPVLADVFTPEVLFWRSNILAWSAQYGLDPNLVATVMQIESCGHPDIASPAGAMGLFQVMPFHFAPDEDPLDPETNARRGLAYLTRSVDLSGGRPDLALAGYNGGHGQIDRPPSHWPDETRRYVAWGFGILGDIADGHTESDVLQAWLDAGGDHLCLHARETLARLDEGG